MAEYLSRFEQKLIDNLTIELIEGGNSEKRVANLERAASLLDCSVAELVVHYLSVDVLNHTPRLEGVFGAANGDFYFDLGYVRDCLKRNHHLGAPLKYVRKLEHRALMPLTR